MSGTGQQQLKNIVIRLQEIKSLCKPYCKMRDPERCERLINEFIRGGPERIQVVTDFDYTLTKQHMENGAVMSSFSIFKSCPSLPADFVTETQNLYNKYRPIEIDPHMPIEEKTKHMIAWWTFAQQLAVGLHLDPAELDNTVAQFKDSLRDHTKELFQTLNSLNIPVLVFSAGQGDVVVSVLRQANVLYPNVKVVSNFLEYENDVVKGFKTPMIHTFNKNETVLHGTDYYDMVRTRDHIILMGDSIGDKDMANGVPASSHIIKIGFLFDHVEAHLEKYMNTFDIVLVDDQTMDVPRELLTLVENYKQTTQPNE